MRTILCAMLMWQLQSCNPDLQHERRVILELNEDQREAHLTNDAELLTRQMADSICVIQDGEIFINSKEEVREQFESYFKTALYRKWDDVRDPVVELSADGTHALLIVQKEIEMAPVISGSVGTYATSQWAWSVAYRKINDQWKMYQMSSGRKP